MNTLFVSYIDFEWRTLYTTSNNYPIPRDGDVIRLPESSRDFRVDQVVWDYGIDTLTVKVYLK